MYANSRPKSRREEYREQTRKALIDAAREAFAQGGFNSAGTEAIARAARVTRGAFYHHFEDKLALFDAVVVELCAEAATKVKKKARLKADLWEQLFTGVDAYLDACLDREYSIIVIQNAPAILGESRYREIDENHASALLHANITALVNSGELETADPLLLSRMLTAMICKIAVLLPHERNKKALRNHGRAMIEQCLNSFRAKHDLS